MARKAAYWSEADRLAEFCLQSGDATVNARGQSCLEHLLEYASMADTSELLIHFNIARLAAKQGDATAAREQLEAARKGNHKVIDKRISFDAELSKLIKV